MHSDLTFTDLLRFVWQRRPQFIGAILVGAAIGGGISLVLPKTYESRGSFVGIGGTRLSLPTNLGSLGALASQIGLAGLGGPDASSLSPYFFASLLTADTILTQLATVRLDASADASTPPQQVLTLLHVGGRSHPDSIAQAVRRLRRMLVVDLEARTGVVKVTLAARGPELAAALADTLLGLVNGFVGRDLRTRAGATRRFLQERLGQVQIELSLQQDRLRAFLETNRDYRNSTTLQFREAELQRDLDLKRDLFLSVARSLEEARMNEARDTPLLSIIDRPSVPTRPASPKPALNAILLGLFMPVFWLALVLLRHQS